MKADADPGWAVRVIPNKYPALQPSPNGYKAISDFQTAYGFHEVVIESPRHNADLASMTDAEIAMVVTAYRERASALLQRADIEAVVAIP